jgi:hypothetical protein
VWRQRRDELSSSDNTFDSASLITVINATRSVQLTRVEDGQCNSLQRHPVSCLTEVYHRAQPVDWHVELLIWCHCKVKVDLTSFRSAPAENALPGEPDVMMPTHNSSSASNASRCFSICADCVPHDRGGEVD